MLIINTGILCYRTCDATRALLDDSICDLVTSMHLQSSTPLHAANSQESLPTSHNDHSRQQEPACPPTTLQDPSPKAVPAFLIIPDSGACPPTLQDQSPKAVPAFRIIPDSGACPPTLLDQSPKAVPAFRILPDSDSGIPEMRTDSIQVDIILFFSMRYR